MKKGGGGVSTPRVVYGPSECPGAGLLSKPARLRRDWLGNFIRTRGALSPHPSPPLDQPFCGRSAPDVNEDHSGRPRGGLKNLTATQLARVWCEAGETGHSARFHAGIPAVTMSPSCQAIMVYSMVAARPIGLAKGPPPRACSSRHLQAGPWTRLSRTGGWRNVAASEGVIQ